MAPARRAAPVQGADAGARARDGTEDVRVDRTPASRAGRRSSSRGTARLGLRMRTACVVAHSSRRRRSTPRRRSTTRCSSSAGRRCTRSRCRSPTRLVLTLVDAEPDGDTVLPDGRLGRVARDRRGSRATGGARRRTSGSRPAGSLIAMTDAGEVFTSEQMDGPPGRARRARRPAQGGRDRGDRDGARLRRPLRELRVPRGEERSGPARGAHREAALADSGAVVVDHDTDDHVGPGSIVEIADEQGEVMEVTISSRRRRLSRLAARLGADGRRRRGRRRRRGAARRVAGDRALDPPRVTPVSDFVRHPRSV